MLSGDLLWSAVGTTWVCVNAFRLLRFHGGYWATLPNVAVYGCADGTTHGQTAGQLFKSGGSWGSRFFIPGVCCVRKQYLARLVYQVPQVVETQIHLPGTWVHASMLDMHSDEDCWSQL